MEQITVLSVLNFTESQLDKLRTVSPHLDVQQMTGTTFAELPESLRTRTEILYSWSHFLDDAHLFPRLKWVQTHSAGIDRLLDSPLWRSQAIITSMNGIHSIQMVEHALAMILAFRWKIPTMLRLQAQATWPTSRWQMFSIPELRGSTLGIVGYGSIGRELGRQAQALGMRVLAVNRSGQRHPFTGYSQPGTGDPQTAIPEKIYPTGCLLDMLPECDYVVVLAPLTHETRHLFNAKAFATMKSTAFFFNLARGALVDEAALVEALTQQQIAGAGLDAFEQEPLPPDNPLWPFDNVIISPHVSGLTEKYDERASNLFAENLRRYLAGEPLLNQVERERGY